MVTDERQVCRQVGADELTETTPTHAQEKHTLTNHKQRQKHRETEA